jgi:hypothetical protein
VSKDRSRVPSRRVPSRRVPELLIERLVLGELSDERAAEVLAELEAEEGGLARKAAIEADSDAFAATHPPRPALAEQRQRLDGRRRDIARRRLAWIALPTLAAAATATLLLLGPLLSSPEISKPPAAPHRPHIGVTRIKGPALLFAHLQLAGGRQTQLDHGAVVRPGDTIQLSYRAGDATHGVIASIDGRGAVTLHFPRGPRGSTTLTRKGTKALPNAFELDAVADFERVFLISAEAPIDVGAVLTAMRRLGKDAQKQLSLSGVAGDLAVKEVLLRKTGSRR